MTGHFWQSAKRTETNAFPEDKKFSIVDYFAKVNLDFCGFFRSSFLACRIPNSPVYCKPKM